MEPDVTDLSDVDNEQDDGIEVVVGVKIGSTKVILSEQEARELYARLDKLFGEKAPKVWYYPYYTPTITPYTYTTDYTPTITPYTYTTDGTGLTINCDGATTTSYTTIPSDAITSSYTLTSTNTAAAISVITMPKS